MRLLQCLPNGDFKLTGPHDDPEPYAILSHTWSEGQEVKYHDMVAGAGKDKTGYTKIRFCGQRAVADRLKYFWVDTCCIDKSTNEELTTAINSMFRWYQGASKCYVYLSDVSVPDGIHDPQASKTEWSEAFRQSRWFTRGWTLQELLAPTSVDFFSVEGKLLGNRTSLEQEIHEITKIPIRALRGEPLTTFSEDERWSWAAFRTTTLREDKVYCLLGLFGVFVPLIYGEGEAYATLRLKEEIQKRHAGQATKDVQSLVVCSSLPFPRDERFVGRKDQLQSLEHSLLSHTAHRRTTVFGLGGCGKSALALEFAYRALTRNARQLVFWVPAMSTESFERAYRDIAIRLRIPGASDSSVDTNKLVKEALSVEKVGTWIMIVDNADDPSILFSTKVHGTSSARLSDYLPHSENGAILFTTRSRKAAEALTPGSTLELKDMNGDGAEQLLVRRTKHTLVSDNVAVAKLLDILSYLPLAIVQAAAFINNNDVSVTRYISLFQHTGTEMELFNEYFEDLSRYREMDSTIAQTWHISFDQIRRQDSLAAEYLSFIACIDRVNIPESLLPARGSQLQHVKAIGTLTGYAFITERQQTVQAVNGERFYEMHRLVHMAAVRWLDGHGERGAWVDKAVSRLVELLPLDGDGEKEVWTPYLPHAIHAAGVDGAGDEIVKASLLNRLGRCQTTLGYYTQAETTHRQALLLRTRILPPNHYETLNSMNGLAGALNHQGKYEQAEMIDRDTLARREKVLGLEHLDTLASMSNLAMVLDKQGKYREAEVTNRQVLARYNDVLPPKHRETLISMSNLSVVLYNQGRYKEAEEMIKQTMAWKEEVLGPEHPETVLTLNSLALVLSSQGKKAEAETVYRNAVEQFKKLFGPEHPYTHTLTSNLALLLVSQGRDWEAETMYRRILAQSNMLGSEHPETLMVMSQLGVVLSRIGKYKEAESIHRQTLAKQSKVLGPDHPDTFSSMCSLADVLNRQGHFSEAEAMHRKALARRTEVLGPEHPDTLVSMYFIARLLARQHFYEESLVLFEKTYKAMVTVIGETHPDTRICRQHFDEARASANDIVSKNSSKTLGSSTSRIKSSKLKRGLAKLGIRGSKVTTK